MITNPGAFDPVKMTPEGQTFHGDHASVFYQIPPDARPLPLVLWHGFGQSSKTWQSTPDGSEGYQSIFLRRGFGIYVLDQPRRGNAGRSTQPVNITPVADEKEIIEIRQTGRHIAIVIGQDHDKVKVTSDRLVEKLIGA